MILKLRHAYERNQQVCKTCVMKFLYDNDKKRKKIVFLIKKFFMLNEQIRDESSTSVSLLNIFATLFIFTFAHQQS